MSEKEQNVDDVEQLLRDEIDRQHELHAKVLHEKEVQKERADHWHRLVQWAYARSSEALMMSPHKPRESRQAREQALCDINKKLGGAIR